MVIFKEIEMEGFKKYDNKKKYNFEEGLMGIFGKNESGKSTIGDAISVSLFGVSSTPYNKSSIVTWGKKRCSLRLDFEVDNLYRVKRTIGNKSSAVLEISSNGRWETIEKSITAVDNRIQDILGLDFKSFKNSIFIGQNDLNSLSSLSKQERQSIVNRLSRYDELSKAEKVLKEVIKEIKQNLEILNNNFDNLKGIVDDKNKKFERLQSLIKEKSEKEELLDKEKSKLTIVTHKIKIFEELKVLNNIYDKINGLEKLINENNNQLSLIEIKESNKKELERKIEELEYVNEDLKKNIGDIDRVISDLKNVETLKKDINEFESLINEKETQINNINEKESQKANILKNLNELSHVDEELRENIEGIGDILSDINKLKISKGELERCESLIKEKNEQISKIEVKESEKEEYTNDLKKFEHITPELKEKIDSIPKILSQLNNIRDVQLDKTKSSIEELQKNIKDCKKLINEKQSQLSKISNNEEQINDIKIKLKELEHIDNELKNNLESIGDIKSKIGPLKIELKRIKEDKNSKISILNNEEKLKEDHEKYKLFLTLNDNLKLKSNEIKDTESKIDLKKQDLGELNNESINLNEIESKYESKISTANIFVLSGAVIVVLGLILGAIFNFLLFFISIIGFLPLYKGYNDRKTFKSKLDVIKDKREVFGYLKVLESNLTNLKEEYNNYEQKLKEFEELNIDLLKQNSEAFNNLNKDKIGLDELKLSESKILTKISQYESDLTKCFEVLPIHYKNNRSLNDENLYKELSNLYQEEDKKKSNYKNTLHDLELQIIGKSEIQTELDEFLKEENDLKDQLNDKEKLLKELSYSEKQLEENLEEEYNNLPSQYKESVPIHNKKLDKEILAIYQEQDKGKSNLEAKLHGLDKEISVKPNILTELDNLENEKTSLKEYISKEGKHLNLKLRNSFDILPEHYKEDRTFEDIKLYKDILAHYQEEDKNKSAYNAEIKELDKEIAKKPNIQNEKQNLIDKKINLEKQISADNERLNKELKDKYEILPQHYKDIPIVDMDLGKKLREIYQSEDKKKSNFLTSIKDLENEIARKKGVQDKLKKLEEQKLGYNKELSKQKEVLSNLTTEEDLEYDENAHKSLEERNNVLDKKIKGYEQEIWNLEGNIGTLSEDTKDLEDKKESLSQLKTRIEEREFDRDVNEIAKEEISFTARALREQVMERTEKYVSTFLPKITDNKYRDVKISEDFNIKVYSPEKNDFESIKSLSGGTKDQVLFALRLAFTNAIIGGRSRSKGFALFLDEFLGSFDQNRRIRTLKMLRGLKDYFRQIFLISHIDGMERDVDQIIKTPEV